MKAAPQSAGPQLGNGSPPLADTPTQGLCHPDDRAAQPRPAITARPFIGVAAVLLGAVISTLDSRLTTFGLADVRGAVQCSEASCHSSG